MAERRSTGSAGSKRNGGSPAKASTSSAKSSGIRGRSTTRRSKGPTRGTAPSAPDTSKLHLLEPSTEAKSHVPSDLDAMGQNKRRAVIGHSYGPSAGRQLLFYGLALGVVVLIVVGGIFLTSKFDKGPAVNPDKAPWSQAGAPQTPPPNPASF